MTIGIMLDDDAVAALLISSDAIDEASLSIDLTMEPLFSDREEFFVFSFDDKGSRLFLTFFGLDTVAC